MVTKHMMQLSSWLYNLQVLQLMIILVWATLNPLTDIKVINFVNMKVVDLW
jgi:hypothetical protein